MSFDHLSMCSSLGPSLSLGPSPFHLVVTHSNVSESIGSKRSDKNPTLLAGELVIECTSSNAWKGGSTGTGLSGAGTGIGLTSTARTRNLSGWTSMGWTGRLILSVKSCSGLFPTTNLSTSQAFFFCFTPSFSFSTDR